jgi:hypothetical protein
MPLDTFTEYDLWTPPAVPPLEIDLECEECGRKGAIRRIRTTGFRHECPGPFIEGAA